MRGTRASGIIVGPIVSSVKVSEVDGVAPQDDVWCRM